MACQAAVDKKGIDVLALDMRDLLAIVDYFVITSGTSTVQVQALAQEIEDRLAAQGVRPVRRSGLSGARWILLDYGAVVVHVFHEDERDYYRLERYWQAAPRLELSK
jgi:ribosome-associated protein